MTEARPAISRAVRAVWAGRIRPGDTMEVGVAVGRGALQIGVGQVGPLQVGPGQIGIGEVGILQIRARQRGIGQFGSFTTVALVNLNKSPLRQMKKASCTFLLNMARCT